MAKIYRFDCDKCGYIARVAGDTQEGINVIISTIECLDCRRLYDVVTHATTEQKLRFPNQPGLGVAFKGFENRVGNGFRERRPSSRLCNTQSPGPGESLYYARPKPNSQWQHYPLQCPASKYHRIRRWKEPGRCPKCKNYLQRSPVAFRFWE